MKDKQIIEISTSHVILRTVIFVLAAVIAIFAFTRGVMSLGDREPGWQDVQAKANDECPFYASGIELKFYCEGASGQIRRIVATMSEEYSNALLFIYKLTDPVNLYDGFVNIAYLNQHRNEKVTVPDVLYSILKDAYSKTMDNNGWSMFSGDLLDAWTDILVLDDPSGFDPLVNLDEKARLSSLGCLVSDMSNFTLELDDASRSIVFSVSEAYDDECAHLEAAGQCLDLGLMRQSYMFEYVMGYLKEKGYTTATMMSDFGNFSSLEEDSNEFSFWAVNVSGDNLMFYTLNMDGKEYLRHQFCDIETGVPNDVLLRFTVNANGYSPVEACYITICATSKKTQSQLRDYVKELSFSGLQNVDYEFQGEN